MLLPMIGFGWFFFDLQTRLLITTNRSSEMDELIAMITYRVFVETLELSVGVRKRIEESAQDGLVIIMGWLSYWLTVFN